MSAVAVTELIAWILSAIIAIWLVSDLVRTGRRHDESSLVNAPDPLEDPPAPSDGAPVRSA